MDGSIRFYNYSKTVNEQLILDIIEDHGEYVLHATESVLARHFMDWEGICYLADILTIFRKNKRDYLIGIEIKDWNQKVHPKLCWEYLKTYRKSCEYFYLAARKFSLTTPIIEEVGLINLSTMKVVKKAEYLFPEKDFRASVVRSLKKCTEPKRDIIEDPYQMSLDMFL
ncbi:MAG: hypothetical protein JSV09_09530 [Thermoplasmata archaeon]|nr:MAG: hypothetical protein JSV09_09530 [Thermoplasmata archaeon]